MRPQQHACMRWVILFVGLIALAACDSAASTPTPIAPTQAATLGAATPTFTPAAPPIKATVYNTTDDGGMICRASAPANGACDKAIPSTIAFVDDTIKAAANGTVAAQTESTKFRLLQAAQVVLKARRDLGPGERFLVQAGQALFDHQDAQGEIQVDAGALRIQPLDTAFSVSIEPDGSTSVAVVSGTRGVLITSTVGSPITLEAGKQVEADPAGNLSAPEDLDSDTVQVWEHYGRGPNLDVSTPVPVSPTATLDTSPTNTATPTPVPTALPTEPPFILYYGQSCDVWATAGAIWWTDEPTIARAVLTYRYRSLDSAIPPGAWRTAPLERDGNGHLVALIHARDDAAADLKGTEGLIEYHATFTDAEGKAQDSSAQTFPVLPCVPSESSSAPSATPETRIYGSTCPGAQEDLTFTRHVEPLFGFHDAVLSYRFRQSRPGAVPGPWHTLALTSDGNGGFTATWHFFDEAAAELGEGGGLLEYQFSAVDRSGIKYTDPVVTRAVIPCPAPTSTAGPAQP